MVTRIEVNTRVFDTRADIRIKKLHRQGFKKISRLSIHDVYSIDKKFTHQQFTKIALALSNPVTQEAYILKKGENPSALKFDWAIEVGFLPGVTDNIGNTTKELIEDLLNQKFSRDENVYASQIFYLEGDCSLSDVKEVADSLYNPIIQRVHIKNRQQYKKDLGMDFMVPRVNLGQKADVLTVDLNVSDHELLAIGKLGIANSDGTHRGPLALSLSNMQAIKKYFSLLGRKPFDIELESIAQTWSEHCKHTIFADPMDEVKEGIFNKYIKGATDKIRRNKGKKDFCASVFSDNSGAIYFDDKYMITHKVETHNTPSALDPYGGSVTGIVGVNRDTIGFGLGAKPIANCFGFCFADPRIDVPLYKGPNFTQKMLSAHRIMEGVVEGVNAGGNQSGIPTPSGFLYFDERYRGKPLVFVGTIGLIPNKIAGKKAEIKKALPGDYIVMVGGRVGKDGIHGATFSSEALTSGSPVSAVQIGDPITQKKLSDVLVKEARDQCLYHSITDNGAGGLSCSVAEMAKESGGCTVYLEKVPLKYQGMAPWEIWISESQERMTLAVLPENWEKFRDLMFQRGVEATVIGEFTNSGKCRILFQGKKIMDIDMQFLHYGLPQKHLSTTYHPFPNREPVISPKVDYTKTLLQMLERPNIASFEFITSQYDYIVQGGMVLSPLAGRGRVNSNTVALRPQLSSQKAVILSQAIYPAYSDIDTYHMAASTIDTAIRNIVAAGGNMNKIALLDNFCWCSSDKPQRLGQLRRAVEACYDLSLFYGTPFISGKDSMFNDFSGYDKEGKPISISIPPTLLISSIGVIDDLTKVVSLDTKKPQDLIYLLGETFDEMGASEYFLMLNDRKKSKSIGNHIPQVNLSKNKKLYQVLTKCIDKSLIASSISVGRGGLIIALAKMSIGGLLGVSADLRLIKGQTSRFDFSLFSESQGRIIVTVAPRDKKKFEKIMKNNPFALIGKVLSGPKFVIQGKDGEKIIETSVNVLQKHYQHTFQGY